MGGCGCVRGGQKSLENPEVKARMVGMVFKEEAMAEKRDLQMYEISREDFEKLGRSTQEEAFIQMVIELL
jgi:hypothetical protein